MIGLMILLAALVAGAYLYPASYIGGLMRNLACGRWRKAVPLAIVCLGLAIWLVAAPELLPLVAGLDMSLLADLLLAASAVLVQLNIRRIRHLVRRGALLAVKGIRVLRRSRAPRGRRPARRPKPQAGDDDAPAGLLAWA